jgi:signal transduction histidine kinase
MSGRRLIGLGCMVAVVWFASAPAASARPARRAVLTIYLGAATFPSNPVYDAAIRRSLLANIHEPIEYFAEYLDPDPTTPGEGETALADYIRAKYRGRQIDVVITIADDATRFSLKHRDELFPGVPIVFVGLSQPDANTRTTSGGMTGVWAGVAYSKTLDAALAMNPNTERVYVIANSTSPAVETMARSELRDYAARMPLTYLEAPTVPSLLEAVRAVPPRSIILYIWHPGTGLGNLVYPDAIAAQVAEASPVPVYGTSDLYIGSGVVGGVVRRTAETGARMGELAAEIVNGARAADLPIESSPLTPIFDWRQIRRWGISPATLPAGAEIRFKVPTMWELYGRYIIAALIVMTAQLALIAGLLTQRARRRRAEATIRAGEATLRDSYQRSRHLAGRLLNAQEATRAGIARDLHDGLCQDLASVTAALSELKDATGEVQGQKTQEMLTEIEEDTLAVYNQIRQLSHDLHPPTLRLLGLGSALKAHCREIGRRHGVEVAYSLGEEVGRLDPDVEIALFRIAQEALRNAIVHGSARHMTVSLQRPNGHVELTVSDDGSGFNVEAARKRGAGLGLISMNERAYVFGGDVEVVSQPAAGTTVRVRGA